MPLKDKLVNAGRAIKQFKARPELLLQNPTVRPLHEVTPRSILGKEWWDSTRRAAYRSTGFRCAACGTDAGDVKGDRKHLEGHEVYDVDYAKGRQVYVETVPLCPWCHSYIHSGRLRMLVHAGKIDEKLYLAIMAWGDEVLRKAGLLNDSRLRPYIPKYAEWHRWRLVIGDKKYPPKYTLKEWREKFADGFVTNEDQE